MKMIYNERFGEIPASLYRLIRKYEVSQADFQQLEWMEIPFAQMEEIIKDFSPNGYFDIFHFTESLKADY